MANLTVAQKVDRKGPDAVNALVAVPVGSLAVLEGGMCQLDSSGKAVPATDVSGVGPVMGVFESSAAASAAASLVRRGCFAFASGTAGDAVTQATVGKLVYAINDHTVGATSSSGTRPIAGLVLEIRADGYVWVEVGPQNSASATVAEAVAAAADLPSCVAIPVVLAAHTTGTIAARFTPGFTGHITKMTASVVDPVTTGAKLGTFTAAIAGTPTTGGAVALTSANCTPVGAKVNGSAITAGNSFVPADEITVVSSAVTAFSEGQVVLYLWLSP